jgi:hypothetical protein
MDFLGNENKFMLWSVLQESDVFQNIPNEYFQQIKGVFDNILLDYSKNTSETEIVAMNKDVIPILLSKMHSIANTQLSNKKLQLVYRSEDIKKEREDDFNKKMELQQSNMNELLQPKKPKEVSFAMNNDDKPLGGDMDRIIKDMMASRQRELETLQTNSLEDAKKWIGIPKSTSIHNDNSVEKTQTPVQTQTQTPMPVQTQTQTPMPVQTQTQTPMPVQTQTQTPMPVQTQESNIMNMFKKKDAQKEVLDLLKEIHANQLLLMNKLDNLGFQPTLEQQEEK